MSHEFYSASDYAGLRLGNREFYYGYEVTSGGDEEGDDPGEWCFQSKTDGVVDHTIPFSKLGMRPNMSGECVECLMQGVSMVFGDTKSSPTNFEMVREFHRAFGQSVATSPTFAPHETEILRNDLIVEELSELQTALAEKNLVEVADALTDLAYVVYGMADIYGIDLDACFRAVHESNMAKLGPDGKPILRADGKFLKPDGWQPPDLKTVLGIA